MVQLLYKDEVYEIIGAAMEVHSELGCGFLEAVYQEALAIEFQNRDIPYEDQKKLKIWYKDELLKKEYAADFFCHNKRIVEIKALSEISNNHKAQLLNYLKATNFKLGLLINFGSGN